MSTRERLQAQVSPANFQALLLGAAFLTRDLNSTGPGPKEMLPESFCEQHTFCSTMFTCMQSMVWRQLSFSFSNFEAHPHLSSLASSRSFVGCFILLSAQIVIKRQPPSDLPNLSLSVKPYVRMINSCCEKRLFSVS